MKNLGGKTVLEIRGIFLGPRLVYGCTIARVCHFTMQFKRCFLLIKLIQFLRDILHGITVAEEFDFGPEPTIEVLQVPYLPFHRQI